MTSRGKEVLRGIGKSHFFKGMGRSRRMPWTPRLPEVAEDIATAAQMTGVQRVLLVTRRPGAQSPLLPLAEPLRWAHASAYPPPPGQ